MTDPTQTVMWQAPTVEPKVEPGPDLLPHHAIDYGKVSRFARRRMGLDRAAFARLLCVPVADVQAVEEGARLPSGAGRTLLWLVSRNPLVSRALLRWPKGPDVIPRELRP